MRRSINNSFKSHAMKLKFLSILFTVFAGVFSVCSYAQADKASEKEAGYLSELMTLNAYELMLTRMASQKATSEELRLGAEKMYEDHKRLDAEFTAYANRIGVALNPDKREKYVEKVQKWDGNAVGKEWDKDIAEELVDAHKESLELMKSQAVNDEQLKTLVTTAKSVIQSHLDELVLLKEKVKDGQTNAAATPPADRTNAADEIPVGNEKDAKFLSDLRLMNTYELQLMELILKKGNHRALKDAAHHMLEDHRKLDEKTMAYAATKRYGNDPDESSKAAEKVAKWQQKKGGMEWDADLIEELIDVHKDGIDMLEDAVTDVKDDRLRTIMKDALPAMKMHLEMLEPLKETIKKPWKEKK